MLEIRLLGAVELYSDGVRVDLGRRQERCVLGLLALDAGRVVDAGRLISRVWNDDPPASARATLQTLIARLRGRFTPDHPMILTRGSGYLIDIEPERVDVHRFTTAVAAAQKDPDPASRSVTMAGALADWRGPLLAGAADGPLFARLNAGLKDQFLLAHELYAEAELDSGHHHQVLKSLPDLLTQNPGRERMAALLMRARYEAGDIEGALVTFDMTRRYLADELGLDPGGELVALQLKLLHREGQKDFLVPHQPPLTPAIPVPVPRQLPPDVRSFVGREAELEELDRMLAQEGQHQATAIVISAIAGTAGVGKTTLAVHWAHHLAARYPDGTLYINLQGFDPTGMMTTADEAVRVFLGALGVAAQQVPASLRAKTALYRSLLAQRRMLVVLDNARDAEHVRPLLPGSPGCLVIITSRYQLTGLVAAEGAQPLELGLLGRNEALRLLAGRLGDARVRDEPQAAEQIVAGCAGLPLALALVAAQAATNPQKPLQRLASELRQAPRPLDAFSSDDASTDARAVFSWSYAALSSGAARLFRRLGLHPGPAISARGAASLDGIDLALARTLLSELERAHLVMQEAPDRYTLHDLLRAYSRELAAGNNPADNDRTIGRMLDHYLHTAHVADRLLDPHRDHIVLPEAAPGAVAEPLESHEQALNWYIIEHAELLAVFGLANARRLDRIVWQLAWSLGNYFERQGHWHPWTDTVTAGLLAAERLGDLAAQARCLRSLARASARLGDHQHALSYLDNALELYADLGDEVGEAYVHLNLNVILAEVKRYDHSLSHAQRALALYEKAGHQVGLALSLNALGWCHAQLGNPAAALEHCLRSLELHQQIGQASGEADTWDSIGYAYRALDDLPHATAAYQRALALFHELGDRYNLATTHICLGDIEQDCGRTIQARQSWISALTILRELNHPDAETVHTRLSSAPLAGLRR